MDNLHGAFFMHQIEFEGNLLEIEFKLVYWKGLNFSNVVPFHRKAPFS